MLTKYTRDYLLQLLTLAERYGFEPVSLAEMGSGFMRGDRRAQAAIRELVAGGLLERIDAHGYILTDEGKRTAMELRERTTAGS